MLKVYNTLTRKLEEFHPIHEKENRVYMFVCGPTVYDSPHVGHARSYVAYDVIAKYLRYKGWSLFYVQNITDIDDKIIRRAQETGKTWKEIAREYEEEYHRAMKRLFVDSVNLYARATEHIPEIIDQIKRLMEKGYAYETEDGVYFDITKFPEYGKLSGQRLEDLMAGARVEVNENKRHPYDFALWKKAKPGEPTWESPWGPGRPGWHIEDTAISERYLGQQYDLHGGGMDLIFPHHECEIAQMEAISGKKPFVRYWLHNGFLEVNGEKMSKSLKNFWTIEDVLKKVRPEALRYFLLSTHYRSPINFSDENLEQAQKAWEGLAKTVRKLKKLAKDGKEGEPREQVVEALEDIRKRWEDAMDDDFNTPKALAVLHDWATLVNREVVESGLKEEAGMALEILEKWDTVLTLFRSILESDGGVSEELVEGLMRIIITVRQKLREQKLYEISDWIRAELGNLGIQLNDRGKETTWEMT